MDLQADIYSALYDLIMSIINPTYDPGPDPEDPAIPAIPVLMDEQAHAAPSTGPYISNTLYHKISSSSPSFHFFP
jgi:hypothetical protein